MAFVVPVAPSAIDEQGVLDACREKLADYKVPQRIRFIDAMPVSFIGKIERRTLRLWELEAADQ